MKRYYSNIWLTVVVCIIIGWTLEGCKRKLDPDPTPYSDTGDVEAREITYSPDPAKVNEDTSISFKVANIGPTNVKAHFIYKVMGPMVPDLSFYRVRTGEVKMLQGSVVTDTNRGWHPTTEGGFTIICEAQIVGNDTNPSNNSISLIGWAENTTPTPTPTPPTTTIPILGDPVTIVTPSLPPSLPPQFGMRN